MTTIVPSLAAVAGRYDAVFCDLWGCLHDGVDAFPEAVAALRAFRAQGGRVVLLTNAPRSRHEVARQIAGMAVPDDAWDTIATSGDSARLAMFQRAVGDRVWFIGEPRDLVFFDPLHLVPDCPTIARVDLDSAEGIVCTGPFDATADPALMKPEFQTAIARGLKLLCANPDIVVDRGEAREWCAGALAALYEELGGTALYFGKPHAPVYDLARRRLSELGTDIPDDRILAIGDGILTDVAGAVGQGIASMFVTGGLAAAETETGDDPDPAALSDFLGRHHLSPTWSIGRLR